MYEFIIILLVLFEKVRLFNLKLFNMFKINTNFKI